MLKVTTVPSSGRADYYAKLCLRTGFIPEQGKDYRVSFDIQAAVPQNNFFRVVYGYPGSADNKKSYGGEYNRSVSSTKTTISKIVSGNDGQKRMDVLLLLGLLDGANTFTVSNLKIEEVRFGTVLTGVGRTVTKAVNYSTEPGYQARLTDTADSCTLDILTVPADGAEPWKTKLFVDTGVRLAKDQTQTVEKLIYVSPTKEDLTGLTLQLNLGGVGAANRFTVSGVRVEEVPMTLRDAMPKALNYTSRTSVRRQIDSGYAASIERSDGAATLHLTRVPRSGAEGQKAKLYVGTGARLTAGKTYLVTTNIQASKTMDYELCFNAGQREKGYDVLYGQKAEGGSQHFRSDGQRRGSPLCLPEEAHL